MEYGSKWVVYSIDGILSFIQGIEGLLQRKRLGFLLAKELCRTERYLCANQVFVNSLYNVS